MTGWLFEGLSLFEITIISWHSLMTSWHFNKTQVYIIEQKLAIFFCSLQKYSWMIEMDVKDTCENTLQIIPHVACQYSEGLSLSYSKEGKKIFYTCNYCFFINTHYCKMCRNQMILVFNILKHVPGLVYMFYLPNLANHKNQNKHRVYK